MNELNCTMEEITKRISDPEQRIRKISQFEEQWKKKKKIGGKNEQCFRNVWDYNKSSNICVITFWEEEKKATMKKYSKKCWLKISQIWQKPRSI